VFFLPQSQLRFCFMIGILCFLETASSSNFLPQQGQMTEAGGVFAHHLGGNNSGWHGYDPVTGHHQQGLNHLPEGSTRSRGDIAVPHHGDGEDGPVDASGKSESLRTMKSFHHDSCSFNV